MDVVELVEGWKRKEREWSEQGGIYLVVVIDHKRRGWIREIQANYMLLRGRCASRKVACEVYVGRGVTNAIDANLHTGEAFYTGSQ